MPSRLPSRYPQSRLEAQLTIGTWSPEFSCEIVARLTPAAGSSAWFSANDPALFPFRLNWGVMLTSFIWINGSSAGGGVDMAVYDASFARLISTGTQTGSGNNSWQVIDVTDTYLPPNVTLYLAMARDNTTANRQHRYNGVANVLQNTFMGALDSATDAYPLPDPITNMAAAATIAYVPVMGFACRAIF